MNELTELINYIYEKYIFISNEWSESDKYSIINMQKLRVDDIYNNQELLDVVFNYRNFINEYAFELMNSIQALNGNISCRVKALNSIQFKIENYKKNHEDGKVAIRKCLNDLFGIRIILQDDLNYESIKRYVDDKFPLLKCNIKQKDNYFAVHIYFGNDDNTKFQWELQIWSEKFKKNNYISHAKYKQEYTKWENENIRED